MRQITEYRPVPGAPVVFSYIISPSGWPVGNVPLISVGDLVAVTVVTSMLLTDVGDQMCW